MSRSLRFLLFPIFALLFFGCDNQQEINQLQAETMSIHDNAMKLMGEMSRTSRALKKNLETMPPDAPERNPLLNAIGKMDQADEGMVSWMTNYKEPDDNMPAAEALQYLKSQKLLIEQNQNDIKAALEAGQILLKK